MQTEDLNAVVRYLESNSLKIVTAESCTAGMIASTLAEPPGSGKWLECAFITYSENAKIACLNVDSDTIDTHGLTSEEVARAMASGALNIANANLAIATTGVAGPSAGDGQEPVGTVCIAWAFKHDSGTRSFSEKTRFNGDRNQVREAATSYALKRIQHYHGELAMQDRP
jgi:nicotinamide-nucleotide amidase